MRIAALVLGILGGVIGLFMSGGALFIGGVGAAVGAAGASTVIGGGWAALALSILGIVGGALAIAKPKLAGWFMVIAAVGGFIAVFLAFIVAGPLLLIGGILALVSKDKVQQPRMQQA